MLTFAVNLDPDQALHVGPDLDPDCLVISLIS